MPTFFNFEQQDPTPVVSDQQTPSNLVTSVCTSKALKNMTKKQLVKNLVVISLGFLLLFSSYQALGNLQSTLNMKDRIGIISQATVYGMLILSSMFLPTIAIRKIGCKLSLILCMLAYCPYVAANFYPMIETMIPSAAILGLAGAPLWSANGLYLNEISSRYAELASDKFDAVIERFYGIFFMFFQSSQIWGNAISYFVLKPAKETSPTEESLQKCGIKFCKCEKNSGFDNPTQHQINIMLGVYIGAMLLAIVLIALFLDPLERVCEEMDISALIVATFRHMTKWQQVLLIPITIYSGLEQAFFFSEYTKAFVACPLGIHYIGFVAIYFGVVNSVFSMSSVLIGKYIKRRPLFLTAASCNLGTCIALFLWKPGINDHLGIYVCAGLWGLADAVWQTQINGFYGVLFKEDKEAAFSNYRLWESIGFVLVFSYDDAFCVNNKITILLTFLVLGIFGYLVTEIKLNR